MEEAENEKNELRFGIRLLIKHPDIDPATITNELGLKPNLSWLEGDKRTSPLGTQLTGNYLQSAWGWSKRIDQKRDFFKEIANLGVLLQSRETFIASIIESGGNVMAIVNLPGDINIGSILNWSDMQRLAALRIDLGIEVFPDFG